MKLNKFLLVFIIGILVLNLVSSLGITPGRTTLSFEPGLKKIIDFKVLNNEHKDMSVTLFARGDLKENIIFNERNIDFSSLEDSKSFNYSLVLPEGNLPPGMYQSEIVAMEIPQEDSSDGTLVGSTVAVVSQLQIYSPYPGKYIESEIKVIESGENEKTLFLIPLINRGDQNIKSLNLTLKIKNLEDEEIEILSSKEINLNAGKRNEISLEWFPKVPAGKYKANLEIKYDEKISKNEIEFNIGSVMLEIKKMYVEDFRLGEIVKFEILLDNKWAQELKNVHLRTIISKNGSTISEFKSPVYDLPGLSEKYIEAFWDSEGIQKGNYDGKIILRYGEKRSIEREVQLEIGEEKISVLGITGNVLSREGSKSNLRNLIIILIVGLILINLFWFVVIKKIMRKNKRKK